MRLMLCGLAAACASAVADPSVHIEHLEQLSGAFRAAYEQVAPAVVLVRARPGFRRALPPFHPPIPEFGRPQEDLPGGGGPDGPDRDGFDNEAIGSGTLVDESGYILSNYHVVAGSDSIRVTLSDRRSFAARIVGFDSLIDIAVLKIDAADLPPPAQLGDAEALRIGDWVLAIGHPLGMGSTLTHGIVSALGRQVNVLRAKYRIESFIQTNAVINVGNSGGPLLNLQGQVVGVNTAIATQTKWFIGYGFAVPIGLAREAMADILEHGRVVRGYLGVVMVSVDPSLTGADGAPASMSDGAGVPAGVLLTEIYPTTPAARAGLQQGDVLLRVEGERVDHPNEVQTAIYARDPGEVVRLVILRDSEELEISVILGEREEDELLAAGEKVLAALSLEVQALTARRAAKLGFTSEVAGDLGYREGEYAVVVKAVHPDGAAATKGIRVDDVITQVDDGLVVSREGFVRQLAQLDRGKSTLIWLWREPSGVDVRTFEIGE